MSWAISKCGKPLAVATSIADDLKRGLCQEPEETIRQQTCETIIFALSSYAPDVVVRVQASGSQYKADGVVKYNALSVSIDPLLGFVE